MSASSTKQRARTRERILEAAEAVFADNGYHDALVDEIGKRTSMSKGGLYFHFPSKEDLFFAVNAKSALKLGQTRGVILLAAANENIPIAEYTPLEVKQAVVGYGRADKKQIQFMVCRLLNLKTPPDSLDSSDAFAIAICHANIAETRKRLCT